MEISWDSIDFYVSKSLKFSGDDLFFKSNRFYFTKVTGINSYRFFRVRLIITYVADSFSLLDMTLTNSLVYQLFFTKPEFFRKTFGLKGAKNVFSFSEVARSRLSNYFWVYPPSFFFESIKVGFFGYSAPYFRVLVDDVFEFFTSDFFEVFHLNFFECFDFLVIDLASNPQYRDGSKLNFVKDQISALSFFKFIKPVIAKGKNKNLREVSIVGLIYEKK